MKDYATIPNVERKQQDHHESPPEESSQGAAVPQGPDDVEQPDQVTRKARLKELQSVNSSQTWNCVEINFSLTELQKLRRAQICRLGQPLNTVLEESVG